MILSPPHPPPTSAAAERSFLQLIKGLESVSISRYVW